MAYRRLWKPLKCMHKVENHVSKTPWKEVPVSKSPRHDITWKQCPTKAPMQTVTEVINNNTTLSSPSVWASYNTKRPNITFCQMWNTTMEHSGVWSQACRLSLARRAARAMWAFPCMGGPTWRHPKHTKAKEQRGAKLFRFTQRCVTEYADLLHHISSY